MATMIMPEREFEIPPVDFGAWVKQQLDMAEVQQAALSTKSGIVYPALNRLLNSGKGGKPIRPDHDTISSIAQALVALRVIDDPLEAFVAAGYVPEGYRVVKAGAGSDLVREPFIDDVLEAGYSPDLPDPVREEILDYIRFKAKRDRGE